MKGEQLTNRNYRAKKSLKAGRENKKGCCKFYGSVSASKHAKINQPQEPRVKLYYFQRT